MLACTFLVGGLLLAGAAAAFPGLAQDAAPNSDPPAAVFVLRAVATQIALILPAALLLVCSGQRTRWRIARGDAPACAGALVAMLATNGAGSWLMSRIGESYEGFPSLEGDRWIVAAAFCCAVLLAPIAEELYFREALLMRVFERSGRPYALAVTSLLFGGLHVGAGGAALFVSLSILGALLGWVRLRTGSIGAAIAVHALHNALAWSFAVAFARAS